MTTERFSLNGAGAFIGKDLGTFDWITMSQARECRAGEARNPVRQHHRARVSDTGDAGGDLVRGRLVKPAGISQVLNYGLDRVRFLAPVKSPSQNGGKVVAFRSPERWVAVANRKHRRLGSQSSDDRAQNHWCASRSAAISYG
jgi:hypothetical protein